MKLRTIYTVLIYLLCLTSCNQSVHRFPEFSHAEALMNNRPDSARTLLLGLKKNINKENRATRMYYDLLLTKADDKCYIPHTSDSIMLEVADYYKHHGKPIQKMEAYYLLGRVYSDMQYTGEAISSFRKALNTTCDNSADSYIILARANNQIGQTYMYQDMYKEALPFFYKCYQFATIAKDTSIAIYALRDIGRNYQAQKDLNRGIHYFKKAAALTQNTKREDLYKIVMNELSGLYNINKEYIKSKQALLSANGLKERQDLSIYYLNKGDLYQATGQTDSAEYYYKKGIESNDIFVQQAASYNLYRIYKEKNDYQKTSESLYKCLNYTDSINTINITSNKSLIQSLNKKLAVEKENNLLQKDASHQQIVMILIIVAFIFSMLYTYSYVRRKRARYEEQQRRLKIVLEAQKHKSEQTVEANNKRIAELEKSLFSSLKQNDELQKQLMISEKDLLRRKNIQIEAEQEQQKLLQQRLERSDIYHFFHQNIVKVKDEDYEQLEDTINETYNNFTFRLRELYPSINTKEMHICWLLKIGLRTKEIKNILNSSSEDISMCRLRLYKKIFNKKGTTEDLCSFIRTF